MTAVLGVAETICTGAVMPSPSSTTVSFGKLNASPIVLDAWTYIAVWETKVEDHLAGYYLTLAASVVKDKILIWVSGGEVGSRGFV